MAIYETSYSNSYQNSKMCIIVLWKKKLLYIIKGQSPWPSTKMFHDAGFFSASLWCRIVYNIFFGLFPQAEYLPFASFPGLAEFYHLLLPLLKASVSKGSMSPEYQIHRWRGHMENCFSISIQIILTKIFKNYQK